jgi:hypothetical protein
VRKFPNGLGLLTLSGITGMYIRLTNHTVKQKTLSYKLTQLMSDLKETGVGGR